MTQQMVDWNVLTSQWIDGIDKNGIKHKYSPLEALKKAHAIRFITAGSPLDLFAIHRFLLSLIYWKADCAGSIHEIRDSLLKHKLPDPLIKNIEYEAKSFQLFDDEIPFLQDTSVRKAKTKSAGSLFSEFATGTNIAHFHHGDDKNMQLCLRCATLGMIRLIPWTQSGGAGLSPSVHGAPPIMALALGETLSETLGDNLVMPSQNSGNLKWTGCFVPTNKESAIPYLEAFSWNPRRINLLSPINIEVCWRCGATNVVGVGPIVYLKNDSTKKDGIDTPFNWKDPAAFYPPDVSVRNDKDRNKTLKSSNEYSTTNNKDIKRLFDSEASPESKVIKENLNHAGWCLVIPCTNPANNKTFDHRLIKTPNISLDDIVIGRKSTNNKRGFDGWKEPEKNYSSNGARLFVKSSVQHFSHYDWSVFSAAAFREMHESPVAYDLFTGLLWALRGKVKYLPSRNAGWLVLKLMASVPPEFRVIHHKASYNPLHMLKKRQIGDQYPVSLPRGYHLEEAFRNALDKHIRKTKPYPIDWPSLCSNIDQLIR